MPAYSTAWAFAAGLGFEDQANLLGETLDEEDNADETLGEIADGVVNPAALEQAEATEK